MKVQSRSLPAALSARLKTMPGSPRRTLALVAALAGCAAALPATSRAAFTLTIAPDGLGNVVETGIGTLNLTALVKGSPQSVSSSAVNPSYFRGSLAITGPAAFSNYDFYTGASNPGNFGTGGLTYASSGTGNNVGISEGYGIYVPYQAYTSGSPLSGSSTFNNTTIAALGLTPGTYTARWGAGTTADSFVVTIVPEPSTTAIALLALGSAGGLAWRKRRSQAAAASAPVQA